MSTYVLDIPITERETDKTTGTLTKEAQCFMTKATLFGFIKLAWQLYIHKRKCKKEGRPFRCTCSAFFFGE